MIIYVASPLKAYPGGTFEENKQRALSYCRAVAQRGFFPIAPHGWLTSFLDDHDPTERSLGLHLGLSILPSVDQAWFFGEYLSDGMRQEIRRAAGLGIPMRWFKDGVIRGSLTDDATNELLAASLRVTDNGLDQNPVATLRQEIAASEGRAQG